MSFFKRIANLFRGGPSAGSSDRFLEIYALNRRCNEPVAGQLDLLNELSQDEDEGGYFARKVLHTSGEKRCFSQVEFMLWFDKGKRLVNHEVDGGRWLDASEYAVELERFNTPPEEEVETDDQESPGGATEPSADASEAESDNAAT